MIENLYQTTKISLVRDSEGRLLKNHKGKYTYKTEIITCSDQNGCMEVFQYKAAYCLASTIIGYTLGDKLGAALGFASGLFGTQVGTVIGAALGGMPGAALGVIAGSSDFASAGLALGGYLGGAPGIFIGASVGVAFEWTYGDYIYDFFSPPPVNSSYDYAE